MVVVAVLSSESGPLICEVVKEVDNDAPLLFSSILCERSIKAIGESFILIKEGVAFKRESLEKVTVNDRRVDRFCQQICHGAFLGLWRTRHLDEQFVGERHGS